jgi:hypothetical protein
MRACLIATATNLASLAFFVNHGFFGIIIGGTMTAMTPATFTAF